MAWWKDNAIDCVFGLPGNATLDRAVDEAADDIRTRRALDQQPRRRGLAETRYQANSWKPRVAHLHLHRSHDRGPRHPFCRHQLDRRHRRAYLRDALLARE
jgi:hypothetical protein